jgi:glycosyltransferase involved in cell wall biosynthesis
MDLFLFPSLHEGLGLVLVEAQAAGLPAVYADVVPREADVAPPLLFRLPLTASAEVWADRVIRSLDEPASLSAATAYQRLSESAFGIRHSVSGLRRVYSGEAHTAARSAAATH